MFTDNLNVSRRTVTRTAAWSVPAVAVVAGAPAYAASSGDQTITRNLKYRVWVKLNGDPVPQPQDGPADLGRRCGHDPARSGRAEHLAARPAAGDHHHDLRRGR